MKQPAASITRVFINIKILQPNGKKDLAGQMIPLDCRLPDEELSPTSDKIIHAAMKVLGVKP